MRRPKHSHPLDWPGWYPNCPAGHLGGGCRVESDHHGDYYCDSDEYFASQPSLRQRITNKIRTTFQGPKGDTGPMGMKGDKGECCCRVHHD